MKRATKNQKIMTGSYNISIHALMKRATTDLPNIALYPEYFNPRPHEEGDIYRYLPISSVSYFNPRPHEEGDKKDKQYKSAGVYFNPRPHEEGDTLTVTGVAIADISIHALMKRATS